MNIVLPKSLAEPLCIPWWDITPYGDKKAIDIHSALSAHMKWRRRNNHILSDDGFNQESIIECLREIVQRGGGRWPIANYRKSETGYFYTISYQVNQKFYRYSVLLCDKKARYAR